MMDFSLGVIFGFMLWPIGWLVKELVPGMFSIDWKTWKIGKKK